MVKTAILGAGFMGGMHAACYARLADEGRAAAAWIVDADPGRARALAGKYGSRATDDLDMVLRDPAVEAIDICLPTHLHREYVERACAAGKHILCEKPIAVTIEDADRMIAATERAGVKFMVAQVIRFWPEYQRLTEIHRSGELGRLLSLSLRRMGTAPTWTWQNWMLDEAKSGLAVLDLHIHDTDYLYHLLGEPREICSRRSPAPHGRIFSLFTYPGVIATAEAGWDTPPSLMFMMAYQAIFEKGVLDFDTRVKPAFTIYRGDQAEHPEFETVTCADSGGNLSDLGGYYREISYFVDCLAHDRQPELASGQSARASLALVRRELAAAAAAA